MRKTIKESAQAVHLTDTLCALAMEKTQESHGRSAKINAIRCLRTETGCGLSEAKWLVENDPRFDSAPWSVIKPESPAGTWVITWECRCGRLSSTHVEKCRCGRAVPNITNQIITRRLL
jgi:hypothetical protein